MNEEQFLELCRELNPELYALYLLSQGTTSVQQVFDAITIELQNVLNHGWGSVVITVKQGQIAMVESTRTTMVKTEQYQDDRGRRVFVANKGIPS